MDAALTREEVNDFEAAIKFGIASGRFEGLEKDAQQHMLRRRKERREKRICSLEKRLAFLCKVLPRNGKAFAVVVGLVLHVLEYVERKRHQLKKK